MRDRRLWLAIGAAAALILFRSFVFLRYEQNFDSDQAIVGLMAKHLSEFRSFPLFFYGQNYMLGVEAWIAAPFFWVGGPTVAMLRLPLMLINIAVVVLLFRLLRAGGVSTGLAFVATLPIAAGGPVATAQVLSALGASIEPLLYIIVLWMLRDRPVPFGVVLGIGSIHREFTIFALPAIALLQWLNLREVRWPAIFKSGGAFAVAWIAIDQLKRHASIMDPTSGDRIGSGGSLALEAVHVGRLLSFDPGLYFGRLHLLLTQGLPDLFGARPLPLFTGGIWGDGSVGSWIAGTALAAALVLCISRLLWMTVRGPLRGVQFQVFLALVALQALFAYGLHGGTEIEFRTELNYVLLVMLLPVAILGAYFRVERTRVYVRAAAALVSLWALAMLSDTASLAREYIVSPPPSPHRMLADYLTSHGIRYASAGYWDSYRVTFLSRERVIVASDDIVRVPAYQTRVELNRANAARIVRMPCGGGTPIAEWCVIDPFQR
jgi:hypothetical protein